MAGRVMLNPWIYGRSGRNPSIPVKYKYGKMGWSGQLWSASAVQQVLQHMQPILRNKFGEYTWSIDGYAFRRGKGGYQIIAQAGKDTWTEGRGRTPQEALKDWRSGWSAIQEYLASPGSTNPPRKRSRRRNLPLTVYVGRKRHTRSALLKKFGALKGHRYWRRAKTKYHGYGAFGARCKTRRMKLKNARGRRR